MKEHPIEGLMHTAMSSIKDMIDVNTIIGDPIETSNSTVIIPISKVSFGFASGGSEFQGEAIEGYRKKETEEAIEYRLPFGGGSGAGASVNPIAFLVIQPDNVKLMPVNHTSSVDKLIDFLPDLVDKATKIFNSEQKENKTKKIRDKRENIMSKIDKMEQEKNNIKKKISEDINNKNNNDIRDTTYEFEYNEILEDE